MRAAADPYRLVFTLPVPLRLSVPLGRHQPCLAGCVLAVNAAHQVAIEGPHRDAVFDQVRRFLRVAAKGHGAFDLTAILTTPASHGGGRAGSDPWHIIVGAEIAIVPGSIPGRIYQAEGELDERRPVRA